MLPELGREVRLMRITGDVSGLADAATPVCQQSGCSLQALLPHVSVHRFSVHSGEILFQSADVRTDEARKLGQRRRIIESIEENGSCLLHSFRSLRREPPLPGVGPRSIR